MPKYAKSVEFLLQAFELFFICWNPVLGKSVQIQNNQICAFPPAQKSQIRCVVSDLTWSEFHVIDRFCKSHLIQTEKVINLESRKCLSRNGNLEFNVK